MKSSTTADLRARAVEQSKLAPDVGRLTLPRSWGVYELSPAPGAGQRFRLGNHPVRHDELTREFGKAAIVSVFTSRADAVELKRRLLAG